jgi:hypothetical protein
LSGYPCNPPLIAVLKTKLSRDEFHFCFASRASGASSENSARAAQVERNHSHKAIIAFARGDEHRAIISTGMFFKVTRSY